MLPHSCIVRSTTMEMKERKEGDALIVKILEKRFAADAPAKFKENMADRIEKGNDRIILDVSDVEFIDSAGLAALVHILKLLQQKDKFLICGAQGPVKNVFELTRMDKVFQIYADEKAAIAALST
jgi:anti-sigma B factor antagonist